MNDQKTRLRPLEEQKTDEELVRLICNRDQSALDSVIRLYGGQVNSISKRICCDDLEASGVVSEVFWELWQNATQFRFQRGTLRSYLITKARSRALRYCKRLGHEYSTESFYVQWLHRKPLKNLAIRGMAYRKRIPLGSTSGSFIFGPSGIGRRSSLV